MLAQPIVCSTPMPSLSEIASRLSTPAWDPSSQTPEYHTHAPTPPILALSDHSLLQTHLLDVKAQVKMVSGKLNLAKIFVSGSVHEG